METLTLLTGLLLLLLQCQSANNEHDQNRNGLLSMEAKIQKQLYRHLYMALYQYANHNKDNQSEIFDIILRRTGLILNPSQFEIPEKYKDLKIVRVPVPGHKNQSTAKAILRAYIPPRIVQAMFDLCDMVPNMTHWIGNPEDGQVRFSENYVDVVHKILDRLRNDNVETLQDLYEYLKEPLPDPESESISGQSGLNITRLALYNRYKLAYYQTKLGVESELHSRKRKMSQRKFEAWRERHAKTLQDHLRNQLQKWYELGKKEEIEDWFANMHTVQEMQSIEDAKRLLEAFRTPAWDEYSDPTWEITGTRSFIYKVQFLPTEWYKYLKPQFNESQDQINYRLNLNNKRMEVLRVMRDERIKQLSSKDYLKEYRNIRKKYFLSKSKIMQKVIEKNQATLLCRYTNKKSSCRNVTLLRSLIEKLREKHTVLHWKYQSIRSSIPRHGSHILKAIRKELNASINASTILRNLKSQQISNTLLKMQTNMTLDNTDLHFFKFHFNPQASQQKVKHFNDFRLPQKLKESRLWYLNRDRSHMKARKAISKYLKTVEGHLNTLVNNITVDATIIAVDVERKWFNQTLFRKLIKFSKAQILVSPGPRSTPFKFRKSVSSGQYLLPAFPASLLIATDIQISIPSHSLPPKVITDLLALSYEPLVSGGYGPFSFGRMYGDNKDGKELYKFRVQRENGSLLLSLPGGQLIGYACHIVVKFPANY